LETPDKSGTVRDAIVELDESVNGAFMAVARVWILEAGTTASITIATNASVGSRDITTHINPPYRFVWQVEGALHALSGSPLLVVMLLDYRSGAVLYDISSDLPGVRSSPSPGVTGPLAWDAAP